MQSPQPHSSQSQHPGLNFYLPSLGYFCVLIRALSPLEAQHSISLPFRLSSTRRAQVSFTPEPSLSLVHCFLPPDVESYLSVNPKEQNSVKAAYL